LYSSFIIEFVLLQMIIILKGIFFKWDVKMYEYKKLTTSQSMHQPVNILL